MSGQATELIHYRMQQKRDSTQKWNDSAFVPKDGEIIVYKDEGSVNRIKIGDGQHSLDELKFITGEIYVQEESPESAGEGAIWINPNNLSEGQGGGSGENIALDTTLTKSGMAAEAKAVGDRFAALPVTLSEDGYSEVANQRKILNVQSTKTADKINIVVSLEGGKKVVMDVGYNANNYPTSLTLNGHTVTFGWTGF